MMFYLNILFITLIFVIGIDVLHFWEEISKIISGILTKGKVRKSFELKPFSCSTCMSWWTNLVYMFIAGHFSILNVLIILILSMLAPELAGLIYMFKSWLDTLINKITIK